MLEFKVVLEKADAQQYLKSRGINTDISKMMVMCAFDADKIVSVGALSMDISAAVLEEVAADEDAVQYAMGKVMLNALDLGGVKKVFIKNKALSELAKKLCFTGSENGVWQLNLEGYFTGGCKSQAN